MTSYHDPVLVDVLVADDGMSEKNGKTAWPEYPGETPSKKSLITWVEAWTEDLNTSGFSALLRKELPYEVQRLADKPAIVIPDGADDPRKNAIHAENARIASANITNKAERESRLLEMRTRVYGKLSRAMRVSAPLRLKKLMEDHPERDAHGDPIPDAHDGVSMFLDIKASTANKAAKYDAKKYELMYEKYRDTKLGDNVPPDAFAKRLNAFTVTINPFMPRPLEGDHLSTFIIEQLPSSLASDGRTLTRDLERLKVFDDPQRVLTECLKLVQDAHVPTRKAAPVNIVDLRNRDGAVGPGGERTLADLKESDLKKLIAAVARDGKGGGAGGGPKGGPKPGDNKKEKKGRKSSFVLPEGVTCKAGYCNFNHDEHKPGEPCYRDPEWGGPLPLPTHNNPEQLARIQAARRENAVKFNKTLKELQPPPGAQKPYTPVTKGVSFLDMLTGGVNVAMAGGSVLAHDSELGSPLDDNCPLAEDDDGGYQLDDGDVLESPRDNGEYFDPVLELAPGDLLELEDGHWAASSFHTPGHEPDTAPALVPDVRMPRVLEFGPASGSPSPQALGALQAALGAGVEPTDRSVAPTMPPETGPADRTTAEGPAVSNSSPLGTDTAEPAVPPPAAVDEPQASPPVGPASSLEPPTATAPPIESIVTIDATANARNSVMDAAVALGIVMCLLLGAIAIFGGSAGVASAGMQMIGLVCSNRALSRTLVFDGACHPPVPLADTPRVEFGVAHFAVMTTTAYLVAVIAELWVTTVLRRLIWRATTGTAHLARRLVTQAPRHVRGALGFASAMTCLFLLLNGVGATPVNGDAAELSSINQVYQAARSGASHMTGDFGDRLRFAIDDLSLSKTKSVSMPALLLKDEAEKLALILGDSADELEVLDTGAAIHVEKNSSRAIPGSIRPNDITVHTASGPELPPWQCDALVEVPSRDGPSRTVVKRGAVIMEGCPHNLTSLGKWARDEQIGTTIGAGANPSFLSLPGGFTAPVFNLGIIVLPSASMIKAAATATVARGARNVKHLSGATVHARGNHAMARTLRNWHRCTNDIDQAWSSAVKEDPCDSCLKANAPAIPSNRSNPAVEKPGDLISFDVLSLGVKHVHGGQSKVWGAHDHKSNTNFVCLLHDESTEEIARALRECYTYFHSKGATPKWFHTDNYSSHLSKEVVELVRDEFKCRYTTSSPNTPRSNGTMERQWGTMTNDTRGLLEKSKLPRNYAWYALQQAVAVRNTLPLKDNWDECPLSILTGKKPSASHFRVFGCVVYCKVFDRVTKMANQAVRCIHLGRAPNQSGYLCYNPESKKMFVSVHCSFVETAFPGLTMAPEGWEQCVPEFADEFVEGAPRAPEGEFEPLKEGSVLEARASNRWSSASCPSRPTTTGLTISTSCSTPRPWQRTAPTRRAVAGCGDPRPRPPTAAFPPPSNGPCARGVATPLASWAGPQLRCWQPLLRRARQGGKQQELKF
jgi:hypothetical protein